MYDTKLSETNIFDKPETNIYFSTFITWFLSAKCNEGKINKNSSNSSIIYQPPFFKINLLTMLTGLKYIWFSVYRMSYPSSLLSTRSCNAASNLFLAEATSAISEIWSSSLDVTMTFVLLFPYRTYFLLIFKVKII